MALFRNRSRDPVRRGTAPDPDPWEADPVVLDPHLGMSAVDDYIARLRSGDFRAARSTMASATPIERRTMLESPKLSPDPPIDVVEQWVAAAPEDGVGRLVLGALFVTWGWEARSARRADQVAGDAWPLFFERLRRADSELLQAARLLPGAVEPFVWLIASGRGLQIPLEELSTRFDEGHRLEPFSPLLVNRMLQTLCAKWVGSDEKMFAFARWVTEEAPLGSPARDVMAQAHIEMMLSGAPSGTPLSDAAEYLERPDVVREITAAADLSIFHPDFVDDAEGVQAANTFLLAFSLGKQWATTKRIIDLIDGRYTSFPASYLGDPGKVNRKIEVLTARNLTRANTFF